MRGLYKHKSERKSRSFGSSCVRCLRTDLEEIVDLYTTFMDKSIVSLTTDGENTCTYASLKELGKGTSLVVVHIDDYNDTSVDFGDVVAAMRRCSKMLLVVATVCMEEMV